MTIIGIILVFRAIIWRIKDIIFCINYDLGGWDGGSNLTLLVHLNLLLLEPVLIIADQAGADDQVERNADKGSQTSGCLSEHQLVKAC